MTRPERPFAAHYNPNRKRPADRGPAYLICILVGVCLAAAAIGKAFT